MSGIDLSGYVRVVNGTDKAIKGRFDGRDYVFPPSRPVDVPQAVATHVFGFGLEDKTAALARLGWATTSDQIDAAIERLQQIRFNEVPPIPMDVEDFTPASAPARTGMSVRPLASASGEAPAVPSVPSGAEPREADSEDGATF